MDNLFGFLISPAGQEATHAVVILVTAVAGYLSFLAHRKVKAVDREIRRHLVDDERHA